MFNFKKRYYNFIFNFEKKNIIRINVLNRKKNRNYVSLTNGLFLIFFKNKKNMKKKKLIKFIMMKFFRKFFFLTGATKLILILKKKLTFFFEMFKIFYKPLSGYQNFEGDEIHFNIDAPRFKKIVYLQTKSYVKNKIKKEGRIKRKIRKKLILKNKIFD